MTILLFIVILAALVFVHELGHFLAAKFSKIRVDEFALGFPPRIMSFTKGETKYAINLIPFGGYVKIFGEDPNDESISGTDKARSFVHKPKSIQAFVLAAGILGNIIFAWLLLSLGFMIGMPVPAGYSETAHVQDAKVTITLVSPASPAQKAGIMVGDVITSLATKEDMLPATTIDTLQTYIASHPNQEIAVQFTRAGVASTTYVTPVTGVVPGKAAIGVAFDLLGTLKLSFFSALYEGAKLTWNVIEATAIGLGQFLYQIFTGTANYSQVSGPVGIAGLVGDANRLGLVYLISFTAFISVNLAIINLLPFPALDGGRLLFVFIEKIKRSPIKPKVANTMNAIGLGLLLLLMVVITFHDILKLFT